LQKGKTEMRRANKNCGFTLIELMIVVAILGILAAVAIASYNAYIRRSRNAEATAILADIRLKQEAYRGAFHQYANVGDTCGGWVPRAKPTMDSVSSSSMSDENTTAWRRLGVVFPAKLYFVYDTQAGVPGGTPVDRYAAASAARDFWYGAAAMEDLDGDGKCGGFVVVSGDMRMAELDETTGNCTYE
jgi:prepilin-type N-terminal cleavage/methylation domain-containing protein